MGTQIEIACSQCEEIIGYTELHTDAEYLCATCVEFERDDYQDRTFEEQL